MSTIDRSFHKSRWDTGYTPGSCEVARLQLMHLPLDMIYDILMHTNVKHIVNCGALSRNWNQVIQNEDLWRRLFLRDYLSQYSAQDFGCGYNHAYKDCFVFRSNFSKEIYCSRALAEHTQPIRSCIFYKGKIFSGSEDNTIKMWDLVSGKCVRTLVGHENLVGSLAITGGKLISGDGNGEIRIWDTESGNCLNTIKCNANHDDPIQSIAATDQKIVSSSQSGEIKIWEIETGKHLETLPVRMLNVSCLHIANGIIFFGSSSTHQIKRWDLEKRGSLDPLEGHKHSIRSLVAAEGKLCSASCDGMIKIWNLTTGDCLKTLIANNWNNSRVVAGFTALNFTDGLLYSGSTCGEICMWDIETGECLGTFTGNSAGIRYLIIVDGKLISSSYNKVIRIHDFKARNEAIFEEIARLFQSKKSRKIDEAMRRFSKMPKRVKDVAYRTFDKILPPRRCKSIGYKKPACYSKQWELSTSEQKRQAIHQYLHPNNLKNRHLGSKKALSAPLPRNTIKSFI